MSDTFSAADLEPSDEEKKKAKKALVDRIAASIAAIAAGGLAGGMIALGACAAPSVFALAPAPFSGNAMGQAFARFDRIALGCAAITLAAEVARTWAAGRRGITNASRIRRGLAVVLAGVAACMAMLITPRINELHLAGAVRGQGPEGELLDQIHHRAEALGKIEVVVALAVVALHVMTIRARRSPNEDEDEDEMQAPLPPGPRDAGA